MKGNTMFKALPSTLLLALSLVLSINAWAQPSSSLNNNTSLSNAYLVFLHDDSVIDHQLSRHANDPLQAVHQLAQQLSQAYGGEVVREMAGEQYGFILNHLSPKQAEQLAADFRIQAVTSLTDDNVQQRSALSVSVSCSYTGLGTLYECTATASGGTPGYTYAWQAANSTPSSFGNIAFIDSCAGFTFESYRVTVTDSNGQQASRTGSVPCTRGGL